MMDLSREINKDIYLHNGFRIFNLPITAPQRKVKQEFDNVESIKQLDGLGSKDSLDVYNNLPFPIIPKPNYIDYQNAKNRLNQPRDRLIDEIFWFWPEDLGNKRDPTFKALKKANVDEALSIWESSNASNANHNFAVYNHILAIDNENGSVNDKYWREALKYWHLTLSGNDFKNLVLDRVIELNDPTMREDYVEDIFRQLPVAILSINASFASVYFKKNDTSNFNRHLNLINQSNFDEMTKQESLQGIFDSLYDAVNEKFEEFENGSYERESDISKIERFLDNVEGDLDLLKSNFSSNFQYQSLSDNIAKSVTNKINGIVMNVLEIDGEVDTSKVESFDFKRIERIYTRIVDMAYGYDVKEATEENLNGLKNIIGQLQDKSVHDKIMNFAENLDSTGIYSAKSYARSMKSDLINVNPNNKDDLSDMFAMSLDAYVVSTVNSNMGDFSKLKELKSDLIDLLTTAKQYAIKSETKNKIDEDLKTVRDIENINNLTPEQQEEIIKLIKQAEQSQGQPPQGGGGSGGGSTLALGCIIWIVIIFIGIAGFLFLMGWI